VMTLPQRILKLFDEMGRDQLDLHVLFESAGNEPVERERVIEAVEGLVREGLLESSSGDFYSLTEKGRKAISGRG
jgi:hypothetical protein